MKKIIEIISEEVQMAFKKAGYSEEYGKVTLSNRPDLCQYQCNGALIAAKVCKKAPILIAREVNVILEKSSLFENVIAVMPGFINITLNNESIVDYINRMISDRKFGCEEVGRGKNIILDYGGPNVAKPLHVGHLRTAIIGESLKRIGKFMGCEILGDVHLGDWGLQIGLIIAEIKKRSPDLVYFDTEYDGEYPKEPPFTIGELEEIYPAASSYAKVNDAFMDEAKQITCLFQQGNKGYVALWKHILNVSIADLKKNYKKLNVYFDLWKKESDAQIYIPDMIKEFTDKGFAVMSKGALVVEVKEESDTKEIPPCILVKSDGATLYSTTDLATIVERMKLYEPDEIIYVVDKRQEMHFEQVFRTAKKTKIVKEETKLTFLGFGTMNGHDGKPFKTRDGGVMRLENLIKEVNEAIYQKAILNKEINEVEARNISEKIGLAALKYADLSNHISKDYIFDVERFTAFEGNTGPYILYTVVRINSILKKINTKNSIKTINSVRVAENNSELNLMLKIIQFNEIIMISYEEYAPYKICQYIYELANEFNRFYHENRILSEIDKSKQLSWIALVTLTKDILTQSLDLLGIETPERM